MNSISANITALIPREYWHFKQELFVLLTWWVVKIFKRLSTFDAAGSIEQRNRFQFHAIHLLHKLCQLDNIENFFDALA